MGNKEFGQWQPLKIMDLESYENSQKGKDLGTNSFSIYNISEEAGHCLVCWGEEELSLDFMNPTC